eukprot:6427-Pyramimonas_sp.AAC.1
MVSPSAKAMSPTTGNPTKPRRAKGGTGGMVDVHEAQLEIASMHDEAEVSTACSGEAFLKGLGCERRALHRGSYCNAVNY